jgi:hypothetical protein
MNPHFLDRLSDSQVGPIRIYCRQQAILQCMMAAPLMTAVATCLASSWRSVLFRRAEIFSQ